MHALRISYLLSFLLLLSEPFVEQYNTARSFTSYKYASPMEPPPTIILKNNHLVDNIDADTDAINKGYACLQLPAVAAQQQHHGIPRNDEGDPPKMKLSLPFYVHILITAMKVVG